MNSFYLELVIVEGQMTGLKFVSLKSRMCGAKHDPFLSTGRQIDLTQGCSSFFEIIRAIQNQLNKQACTKHLLSAKHCAQY